MKDTTDAAYSSYVISLLFTSNEFMTQVSEMFRKILNFFFFVEVCLVWPGCFSWLASKLAER